jgi:LmbE family N-acetylglucosaminyl deacetylase
MEESAGGRKRRRIHPRLSLILAIMVGLVGFVFSPNDYALPLPALEQIPVVDLSAVHSAVVFAPHNDDESLGAGGIIQVLKKQGADVTVVLATNGDGTIFGTMEDFHKVFPSVKDYIRMGNLRQQETLQAMQTLGLQAGDVDFLSYPDRGSLSLWEKYWGCAHPYTSPFNGSNHSTYIETFHPASMYCGQDYYQDVLSILRRKKPDLVIYPNGEDVHPDHWGLSNFVRLALHTYRQENGGTSAPLELTYLVHRPDYPDPSGYRPDLGLLPPEAVYQVYQTWYRLDLPSEVETTKGLAIHQYHSQYPSLKRLLEGFIRQNELFSDLPERGLPTATVSNWLDPSTWQTSDGKPVDPVQRDPVKDNFLRKAVSGTDITNLYAIRTEDSQLIVCGQLRGMTEEINQYTILIKSEHGQKYQEAEYSSATFLHHGIAIRRGNYVCARTSLKDLGEPDLLMVSFTVRASQLGIIDQTAWAFLDVP